MAERQAPMQAQDKLAFLLSLVPFLIEHERISVHDAAAHFGVKPEQVREAVELIAVSGIPGETGQYQHGDLFDLAWDDFEENDQIVLTNLVAIDDAPRFSGREAAALIAGLQYLSALPENADRPAIASLMAKLARGTSGLPSQFAVEGSESDSTLALIRDSVVTRGSPMRSSRKVRTASRRWHHPRRYQSASLDSTRSGSTRRRSWSPREFA
jgi:proteasome accessory factor C